MPNAVKDARTAHDELASLTHRLIAEYATSAQAGSVMRLVARTVHVLREQGVPTTELATVAEPLLRAYLENRAVGPGASAVRTG